MSCLTFSISLNAQLVSGDFEAPITHPYAPLYPEVGVCGANDAWFGIFDAETTAPLQALQSVKLTTIVSPALNTVFGWGNDTLPGFAQQIINNSTWNAVDATVTFQYKYTPVEIDTAVFLIQVSDTMLAGTSDDVVLGFGTLDIYSTPNATNGNFTITSTGSTGTPNETLILASSSIGPWFGTSTGVAGSSLWIDNIVIATVGMNENSSSSMKIYPNPANDILNISANGEISNVVISTLDGKVMKTTNESSIDVSEFTSGMYIYQVTVNGKVSTGNFVKN